ncbi:hypothetical protein [Piscinibacter sp. XHJ-5]|uniref:hypothetical protein n=1 Tax=Piscinibacter sp. XHJ-5 TaxID=3037797 RepID=UPI0024529835|nr:hypothetical protein [Piscinibacter sp. XHJ-5]
MKIAVINFSGNTGKSMLSKNMLVPLLAGAKRISIEDLNDPGGHSDAMITASMFPSLAAEINAFEEDKHVVLDIGASSAKEMVGHFTRLATTRSDIDVWLVPVTPLSKQCADTINTIQKLIDIGVEPHRIVVVPNNITDLSQFELDFKRLGMAAAEMGFRLCDHGVPASKIYDMTRSADESLFDIAADDTDYREKLRRKGERASATDIGRRIVVRDMARDACIHLRSVFDAAVMGQPSTQVERVG